MSRVDREAARPPFPPTKMSGIQRQWFQRSKKQNCRTVVNGFSRPTDSDRLTDLVHIFVLAEILWRKTTYLVAVSQRKNDRFTQHDEDDVVEIGVQILYGLKFLTAKVQWRVCAHGTTSAVHDWPSAMEWIQQHFIVAGANVYEANPWARRRSELISTLTE